MSPRRTRSREDERRAIAFGLFGEVGSLLTASKKRRREKAAFARYQESVLEEFGDILWYLAAMCRRTGIPIETLAEQLPSSELDRTEEESLAALGVAAGRVLLLENSTSDTEVPEGVLVASVARDTAIKCRSSADCETQ